MSILAGSTAPGRIPVGFLPCCPTCHGTGRALPPPPPPPPPAPAQRLVFADLVFDTGRREITRASGGPVALTRTEGGLLAALMRAPGRVVTHDELARDVWGWPGGAGFSRSPSMYVVRLRRKLEAGGGSRLVWNVRSAGYVLREAGGGGGDVP